MSASWKRVREIVERALEREATTRSEFVVEACGEDRELRTEVESLLAAEAESTELSRFAAVGMDSTIGPGGAVASDPRPGMRIGRYLLRREIASGGMGTVFEAEQSNPSRVVALKTVRVGLGSDDARRRFRYEAEALARLQHPNIAHVFEAGIHTGDGGTDDVRGDCPYFAMELVAGARPLPAHAREGGLSIEARLRLFLAVADAVHYGHQRGVIHRDLKPGNILVDERGVPKVIDYGVARVNADDWQRSVKTVAGEVVGTLLYMSPEQLRGDSDAVDVRSDVYSLGAVLHELLSGSPPFDIRDKTIVEALRILTTSEPRPPSAINPAVPRELDWIVLKALARESTRRYSSASDLAADIKRYLDHEPLQAGPPSALYRLRKFARRHRVALAAVSSIMIALAVGIVMSLSAKREAEIARDTAADEARRANETLVFVKSIFAAVRADTGRREARVKDLLDSAAARIDGKFAGQPLIEAAVRSMIGDCYLSIDDSKAAAHQIERAVAIRRELLGDDDLETLRSRIGLGVLRGRQGRRAESEAEFHAAAEGLSRSARLDDVDTVVAISSHANALQQLGRIAEAEAENRRAVALAAERFEGSDEQAMVESMLVGTLFLAGKRDEALALSRKALERCKTSTGGNEHIRLSVRMTAAEQLGKIDPVAGAAELEEVRIAAASRFGPRYAMTIQALLLRGNALLDAGDLVTAEQCLTDALAQQREVDGDESWTTAECRRELAKFLERAGRLVEAEDLLDEAIADATRGLGESDPDVLTLRQSLVDLLVRRGRFDEAEELQRPILAACREAQGETAPQTVTAGLRLEFILQSTSRLEEAVELLQPLAEACRRDLGPAHESTAIAFGNLGWCLMILHRYAEAVPALEAALAAYLESHGDSDPIVAAVSSDLGVAKREIGDLVGSEADLRRCLAARRARLPPTAADVREAEVHLARTLREARKHGEAADLLRGAVDRAAGDAAASRLLLVELRAVYVAAGETERVREIDSKLNPASGGG